MSDWKAYGFSLILCAFVCGILTQIISDTKEKTVVQLVSGVVFAIIMLRPLTQIDLNSLTQISDICIASADYYIAEGSDTAVDRKAEYIKTACEAYIMDKAKKLGGEITAQIFLNDEMIPISSEIREKGENSIRTELAAILASDLGITKEHQKWIRNPESDIS